MNGSMVPELSANYEVSAGQVAAFQQNGHVLLPAILTSEEVAAYHSVILAARE